MNLTLPDSLTDVPAPRPARPDVRVAIVLDEALAIGYAANAAAVLALTLGSLMPQLPGQDLIDADGQRHPGLIPIGLPILKSTAEALKATRDRAVGVGGVTVVDFPIQGQQTTDYAAVCAMVAETPAAAVQYLGIALYGPRTAMNKLVGSFGLLR